jgi:hypothetical protein
VPRPRSPVRPPLPFGGRGRVEEVRIAKGDRAGVHVLEADVDRQQHERLGGLFEQHVGLTIEREQRAVGNRAQAAHGEDVGALVAHDQVDRVVGHDIARERGDGLELAGQDGGAGLGREGRAAQADLRDGDGAGAGVGGIDRAARPVVTMAVRPMGSSAQEMAGAVQDRRA